MKTKKIILGIVSCLFLFSLQISAQKNSNLKTTVFNVNVHCVSCKDKIEKNIAFEKGVKDMSVDLENKTVTISYNVNKTSEEKLIAAFKKIGYEAAVKSNACCKGVEKTNCDPNCKDKAKTSSDCSKPATKKCHDE